MSAQTTWTGTTEPTCKQLRNNLDIRQYHRRMALAMVSQALKMAAVSEAERLAQTQAERQTVAGERIGYAFDSEERASDDLINAVEACQESLRSINSASSNPVPRSAPLAPSARPLALLGKWGLRVAKRGSRL